MSEADLLAGRTREAAELATRALDLARRHNERGHEAWIRRLVAEIAARRDPAHVDEAVEWYGHAATIAGELGMRPLIAHCHRGLGKLYRRTGQREQANEHLTTATTMYREMDMRFWMEKVEAR